jgi:hypothetical protein
MRSAAWPGVASSSPKRGIDFPALTSAAQTSGRIFASAIRPLDALAEGARCDPRHAIFFGRDESVEQICSRLERWFDEHPEGMVLTALGY